MEGSLALVCLVVVLIGFGLLQIFARDLMWELTHWNNQIAGRASERTETWDSWQVVSGVISILIGLGIGCWAWTMTSQQNARNLERTQAAVNYQATQASILPMLDEAFRGVITRISEAATTEVTRARPSEMGVDFPSATLYYGRCEERSDFYLFVTDYRNEDYAYISDGALCEVPNLYVSGVNVIGESAVGGQWMHISYFDDFTGLMDSIVGDVLTPAPTRTAEATARAVATEESEE